jgi:putative ABC transport system permease protein
MIKNYFKIAWRNLINNKLYSLINIGGLAIGMAVSFTLLLYVYDEFRFDKQHANDARLFNVMRSQASNGELMTGTATPRPLGPALLKDYPEIENTARAISPYARLFNYKGKAVKVKTMTADASLLDMFSFDIIQGSRKTAFNNNSSIVITESAAKAIFGKGNAVGEVVKVDKKYIYTIGAIIKDNPQNSSFDFKALISWDAMEQNESWLKESGWGNYSYNTYVLLKQGTSMAAVNPKIKKIIQRYDSKNGENTMSLYPFSSLHLYNDFKNGVAVGGRIEYVRLFLFLAIGILLVACINFMNLSTARSEKRSREVGIRKAIGARRFSLLVQFMGESLLMALLSFMVSLIIITQLLSLFNQITGLQLHLPYSNIGAWLVALAITIFTGLVAGSYPALFLSSFNPVKVLKGQAVSVKNAVRPRQVLVVVQFTFAICLILSSIFIYKQINYIKNKPVGYSQNGLVEIDLEGTLEKEFENFRYDAIKAGAITDAALTSGTLVHANSASWGVIWPGQLPGENKLPIDQIVVTYHFTNTYGLQLLEGRDFDQARPADSAALILNEAAVKLMRFKQPLGQTIKWQGSDRVVVGVVKNFVWGSPYEPVKPAIIGFMKGWVGGIGLRLNPDAPVSKSLASLDAVYKKYNPEYPFQYQFADEKYSEKFKTEHLLGTMASGFTVLAIIISCLGLFGLAAFSAEQRRKEIGIRKVLGASISSLWFKLSQEFLKLVFISFIIGSGISWYYLQSWLQKYTYHTDISPWVFIVTMLLSIAICLLTVSWQAVKAAITNPVKNLRSE